MSADHRPWSQASASQLRMANVSRNILYRVQRIVSWDGRMVSALVFCQTLSVDRWFSQWLVGRVRVGVASTRNLSKSTSLSMSTSSLAPVSGVVAFTNRIWWLCLVPTSTIRFDSDLGYKMPQNLIELYKKNTFYKQWQQIRYHRIKNTIFPHKFCRPFGIACLNYFFRLQYVWFPSHLYVGLIPNSSGHLVDLIVYFIPLE